MTETTHAEVKAIRKPPTKHPLPMHVEARLAQICDVRAPGARLGILAVRLDTLARDAQEALDRVGDAVVANIMGRDHTIAIRAEIGITLRLSLGNGEVQEFPITLRRGEPITEDAYLACSMCDVIQLGRSGEDLNDLMDRVVYCEGEEPSGPKPWWYIDSDAGGLAYCPDHNHGNDKEDGEGTASCMGCVPGEGIDGHYADCPALSGKAEEAPPKAP